MYAYEVTATWDSNKKRSSSTSKYLGVVDENGNILSKGTCKRGRKSTAANKVIESERYIKDFGDGYFIQEFIKSSIIYNPLSSFIEKHPNLLILLAYRLCHPGPMYHCEMWFSGNVLSSLHPDAKITSQEISRLLTALGDESVQRSFFKNYLKKVGEGSKNVIIDATSLPNNIQSAWSAWGYSEGGVEMQFRFHCIVDQIKKLPLFYRHVPGNISDVSTLTTTLHELKELGLSYSFALVDSGYCSEENIRQLRRLNIDFLMRLPAGRSFYKLLILKYADKLETPQNAIRYGKRTLFILREQSDLYDAPVYAYIILDTQRKARDLESWLSSRDPNHKDFHEGDDKFSFLSAGVFILISSKQIEPSDILSAYYTRQSVEQIFGFAKCDLDLLPIRCHSNKTISGYLFLQFLLLVIFVEIREKLMKTEKKFTVEEALMLLSTLKCKVYEKNMVIQEPTKHQKAIFDSCSILVPKNPMGI